MKSPIHNDLPESIIEDSYSDNSEDSGNLVIKEDTEEDTEHTEKDTNNANVLIVTEKSSVVCPGNKDVVIDEKDVKPNQSITDVNDEKEEVKTEPPTPCEVLIIIRYLLHCLIIKICTTFILLFQILDKRYLNLLHYTKLLPAPKNIVHKLTPDGVNHTGKPFGKLAQTLTYVICRVKQSNMHK